MAKLPKGWRVYVDSDPDGQLRRHKALITRHSIAEVQRRRVQLMRRISRPGILWGIILIGIAVLGWRMLNREPLPPPPHPSTWPAEMKAKHMAARKSCEAARATGLAPATKGYPGYWPHLDVDNDGVSCEWSFGTPGIWLRTLMGGS